MSWLRDLLDRILGRRSKQQAPQLTQAETNEAEIRGDNIEKREQRRDSGEEDDRLIDV